MQRYRTISPLGRIEPQRLVSFMIGPESQGCWDQTPLVEVLMGRLQLLAAQQVQSPKEGKANKLDNDGL